MKNLYCFLMAFCFAIQLNAQAPSAFNYQAVLRDGAGNLRTNASVSIRVDILQGSASGTISYAESFATSTNAFGLVNLQIGKGAVISGIFSDVNWGSGPYFIKISVDGTEMGTSQLLSVPYALYAGNGFSGSYDDLSGRPVYYKFGLMNITVSPYGHMNIGKGAYNTTVGYDALNELEQGENNIGIGYYCQEQNISGNDNVAIGNYALRWNISSNFNTAIGNYSMQNTTGSQNTSLGAYSLYNNNSGASNVAVGMNALYMNNSGNANVAIGTKALYQNSLGNENTAVGDWAMYGNTIGKWNVAIGSSAMFFNSESDKNTAVGFEALKNCKYWDNTAIGYQALLANTEGFDNVAIGVNSLDGNTTGDGNTAIGKNAMNSQLTGNNNTAIGFNSDVAEGASNSTAIGYDAFVNASNKIVLGNVSATTIGGFGNWSNYSDRRLKENISYSNKLGLNFINLLKPASYNYINDHNKRRRDGLIAQDVQQVLNELGIEFSGLVIDDDKNKTMNLAYADFVIPLINAVQELSQANRELRSQLEQKDAAIEALITQIKAEVDKLKQSITDK